MKKYVKLTKDLSTLISEVNTYLTTQNIDSPVYQTQLFHRTGLLNDLVGDIPSLATSFSDEELTVKGIGHWCIDNFVRVIPCKTNVMLIPLANTGSCSFNTHILDEGAIPYTDVAANHDYYEGIDTTIEDTIQVDSDVFLVAQDTLHSIKNTGSSLAQFLVVTFEEDISSYFAE